MRKGSGTITELTQEIARLQERIAELEASGFNIKTISGQDIEDTTGTNEERYRHIVDTAYEGIWVLDRQYLTAFVNRRMAEMLGYEPQEMIGKRHDSFLFEEDLPDLDEKVESRRQGIPGKYERRLRRKDGTTLWVHVSATPILNKTGQFQSSFAMFTDISERKEAEQALFKSEAKYRSIFENAVEGMFQVTPDGRLMTVNPAMARIFGYTSSEEMISSVTNIGHQLYTNAEDRRAFTRLLEADGIVKGFEGLFYRQDSTVLWGSLHVRAVKDGAGKVLYHEGILEDITARKTAEEALKTSEEKYRNIFENAVEGIYQITPDGKYLSVNPALARIHGFSSPEEMMETVGDIAQLYVDPSRRETLRRIMEEDGFVKHFEIMMRRKDRSLHWVLNSAHPVCDEKGNALYYEGTIEDITSQKLAEEQLKQAKKTLEGTARIMSLMVEAKDPGTAGHQKRVSALAAAIAREMAFPPDITESITMAGMIHDIGMVSVPAELLSKPARLTEAEFGLVKVHPLSGYDMLKEAELPFPAAEIVLQHHERMDGSGYPMGLKGNEILPEARIMAVADVVEAMTSARPYRSSLGIDAALADIKEHKGTLYDPEVVDTCVVLFRKKGFKLP